MLELYGYPRSRSFRVLWALEESGLDYRYHPVDLLKGEGQTAEYLKLNPSGKVPLLVDGELALSESAAICTYLGDKHPESGLVPRPGTAERARYDQWCYFVLTELEQPLWTAGRHRFIYPDEKKVPAVVEIVPWEFGKAAAVLGKGLAGRDYLVGESFTMADILAAHTLNWARAFKVPHGIRALDDYQERICARAAFSRAREREDAAK